MNDEAAQHNITRLFDTYHRLLRKAIVDDNFSPPDSFEINSAASMIVHYAESLLDYIEMRRRALILLNNKSNDQKADNEQKEQEEEDDDGEEEEEEK